MKKINFELIFKIVVLIQATIIIILLSEIYSSINENNNNYVPNQIGRYKEVKIKSSGFGGDKEYVRILDTETGKYVNPEN
jgi:hypothetical protein